MAEDSDKERNNKEINIGHKHKIDRDGYLGL